MARAKESANPLQPSREKRRLVLARHFIGVVAPLLEAGEQYSDLSVERLITAVGVSRSTFYSYFSDKAALLAAMAEDVTIDLAEAGAPWFELGVPDSPDAVRDALRPLFVTYREHRQILRSITDAASYDPGIRELHSALVARATDGLTLHLQALGRADLDADRTGQWLVWMLERGLYHLVADASGDESERQLEAVANLMWSALYAE